MPGRALHIAWLGPAPTETGGVPGVAAELLDGLAQIGHRIDCFFPTSTSELPPRLARHASITVTHGTSNWQWQRWYSRTWMGAFASGMVARGLASVRLRQQILDQHRQDPYDLIYQFSSIESLGLPSAMRSVPLVIHPEAHSAGELRSLIAERKLSLRGQSRARLAAVLCILLARSAVQLVRIRRAALLICISEVFREHLVSDYRVPRDATIVVPNPLRLERFPLSDRAPGDPPTVLVLGRIAVRKGVENVVAVAHTLLARGVAVNIRVVGGPSLWSDYTSLLDDLPSENAEYVGSVPGEEVPREIAAGDVLLQASSYEPFALTVAEALAAGLPVVGTSEVGAIEGVDRAVAVTVAPGDVEAMADALVELLERLCADPAGVRAMAHAEAQRLFAPELVCQRISAALERLVDGASA
jgi:glycosyltransferase involved in cell wall biosynthesis